MSTTAVDCVCRCPLLLQLDLLQFTRQLLTVEMPLLALSCALLITAADVRLTTVTSVLDSVTSPTVLLSQLDRWRHDERPLPLEKQVERQYLRVFPRICLL